MIAADAVAESLEGDGQPRTSEQWSPYVGTDVKRVSPKGATRVVRLLQVLKDAAHVRLGKQQKPVWVPIAELKLHEKKERRAKAVEAPPSDPATQYVLVDLNARRFWSAGVGRGSKPQWVDEPNLALAYPNTNAAWAGRKYHRKRRPEMFPAHVDIKTLEECRSIFGEWYGARPGVAATKQLARSILDRSLGNGEKPQSHGLAMLAPPSEDLLARFDEWERQRREVAAVDEMAANARAKLTQLELQLDIEMRRRLLS